MSGSGGGTVGALTISSGGILAPGNSPGTLNAGNTTWAGGGSLLWEINQSSATKGTDPGSDWVNITGTLTIASNDAATPSVVVNVSGRGIAAGQVNGSAGATSSVAAHMLPWALANGSTFFADLA